MKSDYISQQESENLIQAIPYEYRGVLVAAAETGFRVGDLCKARACDFDPREGTITLREQKTGKIRVSSVTPKLRRALEGLDGKGIERMANKTYLFEHNGRKPISRSTVWRWVTRTWERLHDGEDRNITPHSFRKLYAVNKRKAGATLAEIQFDLNHERVETTMLYAFADLLHEAEIEAGRDAFSVAV